jgi:hypothetical protein
VNIMVLHLVVLRDRPTNVSLSIRIFKSSFNLRITTTGKIDIQKYFYIVFYIVFLYHTNLKIPKHTNIYEQKK